MNNSTISLRHDEDISIPVPYTFKALSTVAISVVALSSILGNTLVITTFIKTEKLRTSTNYYITSMAVSDLLWVATNWPIYLISRLTVFGKTALPDVACKLGNFLTFVSLTVSVECLVLITVDRFIAIVFPLKVTTISGRIRVALISLAWVIPMGFLSPFLYFSRTAEGLDEPYLCETDMDSALRAQYILVGFVYDYIAPLIIIVVLNVCIMKSLRKTNPVIQGNHHITTRRREQNRRLMKILNFITVLFFVSWTPYYVFLFVSDFLLEFPERGLQEMLFVVCQFFLPFVCTAANSVILFTLSTNYRQALKNCLRYTFGKCFSCLVHKQVENITNQGDAGLPNGQLETKL